MAAVSMLAATNGSPFGALTRLSGSQLWTITDYKFIDTVQLIAISSTTYL